MLTRTREECGNSWRIEDKVTREGLNNLIAKGLTSTKAIHDDKTIVIAILRDFGILSPKDRSHKAKKLVERFTEILVEAKIPCR